MATVRSLDPRTAAGTPQPVPRGRLILALAGLVSLVFAVVSAAWLVVPSTNPFADPDSSLAPQRTLLGAALPPRATAALLLGGCVAGVVVAAVALTTGRGRSRRLTDALMGGFGLVFTLVVGVGLLSEQAIVMAGYLMALLVPAGAVVLGVQVVRTSRVGRWVVGGVVAAASAVFAAGVLPADAWVTLGRNIAGLAEELASIGVVLGLTVAVLLWALVGGTAMRDGGTLDAPGRWVLRHRRTITVLAALGPVPYAALRLTWLTPVVVWRPGRRSPAGHPDLGSAPVIRRVGRDDPDHRVDPAVGRGLPPLDAARRRAPGPGVAGRGPGQRRRGDPVRVGGADDPDVRRRERG